jgi:hypothetical protein
MIPLSIFALCSAISTASLLSWLTYRLVWKSEYQAFIGYNQYVILIYNLLLADLQQALAFLITLNWLNLGRIESPSATCFAQGFLLNMGDVSSCFFVFAIALHTWYSVVLGRKITYSRFTTGILAIWAFVFLLTVLGPVMKGPNFYVNTSSWVSVLLSKGSVLISQCWINTEYDVDRLWFHYIWVFSVQFGTIIVYAHVFLHLRKRLQTIREVGVHRSQGNKERLSQAARYMILYPIIYIVLTLPIASGRMAAMAGNKLPVAFYGVAGSFLTSCGWLDTLLYTLTRRVFIKSERPMTGVSSHVQSRASAAISAQQQQHRRWLGGKRERPPPVPTLNDTSWPLSTFASMTVDLKDLSEVASDDGGPFALAPPGSLDGSRVGTPSADEAMRNQQISMRETTIVAGLITEELLLAQRGILSETRIEITTSTVDELLERRDSYSV